MRVLFTQCLFFVSLFSFANAQNAQVGQEIKDLNSDLSVFETPMATSLKKGVKKSDINKI